MTLKFWICALLMAPIALNSCKKHEADTNTTPVPTGKYYPQVKAIIQTRCTISCHAPSKGMGNGMPVNLETDADICARAQSIKASVADPVTFMNKRMPEGQNLPANEIDIIVQWAAKGGRITD